MPDRSTRTIPLLALAGLALMTGGRPSPAADGPGPGFDEGVGAVLARRCLDCHSGPDPKGKLDLSRKSSTFEGGDSGASVVPGRPDESPLWERVEAGEMPPKAPLTGPEKAAIREWIAAGANWGTDPIDPFRLTTNRRAGRDWWSLKPVARPEVPRVEGARSPVDAFLLEKLASQGLGPAPEASRLALIRRATFDLTGLPPTPGEVDAYLADPANDAYERLVDRLLASPAYGVRWARWWLDLARFGESHGYEFDEFRADSWRYRDWVVEALNRDLPYDEFARLQVAGDVIRPGDPSAVEATGFLVAGGVRHRRPGPGQPGHAGRRPGRRAGGRHRHRRPGVPRPDRPLRPVPRPQVRPDSPGRVLPVRLRARRGPPRRARPLGHRPGHRRARPSDRRPRRPDRRDRGPRPRPAPGRAVGRERPHPRRRLGLRPGARRRDRPARRHAPRGRDAVQGRAPARRQGGLCRLGPARPPPQGPDDRGVGPARQPRPAWGGPSPASRPLDGSAFDAIVFGELEPGRWMAGSEGFRRTRNLQGEPETEANRRPVHLAIAYDLDGTIRAYRDGRPLGESYASSGPIEFPGGGSQVIFGLRHAPAGPGKMLAGTVVRARLYDRALGPEEVAASAARPGDLLPPEAIAGALADAPRAERAGLIEELKAIRIDRAGRSRRAYAVSPSEPGIVRVDLRGNPARPGEVVSAGGVAAVAGPSADFGLPPDAPEAERRRRLAAWIAHPDNPLFARVVVNRLWQAHFGSGLVETPSDLGFNGGAPSHPELLDWLASEAKARGWSLEAMHRLMVTSAAYRQSSRLDPEGKARDAGDRLLWRKAPARLEAEMVRDAMLAVSGKLDPSMGGPSFMDHALTLPKGSTSRLYIAVPPETPGLDRRTLYRAWTRGGRSTLLDAFDCPDPSATSPRRPVTTTPLQALAMMNNALTLHLAGAFADRLAREAGPDPAGQVERAYRLAFGRPPEPDERAEATRVVERFGAATLARALFNSGEFLYLD